MNTFWADQIDRHLLMEHVTCIASHERHAGSQGEAAAFDHIERTLADYGLTVTRHLHRAFISLPESSSLIVGGRAFVCRTHSHAANCSGLNAPLAVVDKKHLTEAACHGRIVMIDGRAEREPLLAAGRAGAVGVVFVPGDVICESCVTPVWGSPDHEELQLMPSVPVVSVNVATAAAISALVAEGREDALLSATCRHAWIDIPLLEAEVRATRRETNDFIMFSGHVDSWYYGATDNGTANSVMLETGRLAALHRDLLERNLRLVFFSGHSQGRYAGSSWYADTFWEDLEAHCQASINADVLGGVGATELARAACMPELRDVVAEAVHLLTGVSYTGSRYGRVADQSFWGIGVSCALASFSKQPPRAQKATFPRGGNPGMGWWWHTPEDTLDKIDPHGFARDAAIFATVVMELATARVLPLKLSAAAQEAIDNLQTWQVRAGEDFDLSLPLKRACELQQRLRLAEEHRPGVAATIATDGTGDHTDEAAIEAYHRLLHQVGRSLVRLNYTRGNAFKNEPAVAQPPMPALAAISLLEKAEAAEREAVLVGLVRARNVVSHALKTALEALQTYGR